MSNKIIYGVASIPQRSSSLQKTISTIINQCDEVNVYLNNYDSVPSFLNHKKINPHIGTDMGDVGKFFRVESSNGYYFTIDDDILYPVDYTAHMTKTIEKYHRKVAVGVHGCILNLKSMNNYYKDRNLTHYRNKLEVNKVVHVVGTGTAAFHTDTLKLALKDFPKPNMADIWFAILAQTQDVPIVLVTRPLYWLKDVPEALTTDSIYSKSKNNKHGQYQTDIIKQYTKWKLSHV